MQSCRVLVVDDEPAVREIVSTILERSDFEVVAAADGESALDVAKQMEFAAAVVDLNLPGISGIETSKGLKRLAPDTEIIMLTGAPTLESSLEAHHEGFFDYLCKPVRAGILLRVVQQAVERRGLAIENRELIRCLEDERNGLQEKVRETEALLGENLSLTAAFVGESREVKPIRQLILDVAPADVTVLIRGESGTGKEIAARLIHEISGRKQRGDFIKINCPAIPEALLESEMFGHEAGAFTGADRRKPGRIELAAGGTVFLDEIGDLPLSSQAKLLQVIEHKQFNRVGGTKTLHINARIIAATNAPLEELIAEGKFRADLFYRLNQFVIHLPPLRERAEDIPLLVDHFLSHNEHKKVNYGLSPKVLSQLVRYDWPGNVRELKFFVDRYVITGDERQILDSLPLPNENRKTTVPPTTNKIDETEARLIQAALVGERWNQRRTAERLGISYSALRRRIDKHGLKGKPVALG